MQADGPLEDVVIGTGLSDGQHRTQQTRRDHET
jgi:hypothetical protein